MSDAVQLSGLEIIVSGSDFFVGILNRAVYHYIKPSFEKKGTGNKRANANGNHKLTWIINPSRTSISKKLDTLRNEVI